MMNSISYKQNAKNLEKFAINKTEDTKIKQEAKATQEPPAQVDTVELSEQAKNIKPRSSWKRFARKSLTTIALVNSLSGPVMAQKTAGTEPVTDSKPKTEIVQDKENCCQDDGKTIHYEDAKKDGVKKDGVKKEETKFSVTGTFVNDNMPSFMTGLGKPQHKTPGGRFFDDDGWTAELRLESNFQKGDSELFVGGRLMMATETGSYNASNSDFQGLRTDVAEFVAQKNKRLSLSDKTTFDYGFGGGLQAIGNLGGESIQRGWHELGVFGGRTGDELQGQQTNDSFRVMPMFTTGAKLTHSLNPNLDLQAGLQGNIPLGNGFGNVGLQSGVKGKFGAFSLEMGGKLDASWSGADELSFMEVDGIRPGAYGRLEVDAQGIGGIYTQVETGGFRNEPTLSVGIRIGGAKGARLNPFK